jgi:hypothetical protein
MTLTMAYLRKLPGLLLLLACSPPPGVTPPPPSPMESPAEETPAPAASASTTPPLLPVAPSWWKEGPKEEPSDPKNLCEVANSNIRKAVDEVLALPAPRPTERGPSWDRRSKPRYLELVEGRFAFRPQERALLNRNGFVVPARLQQRSYAHAYHDIFQSQLPVYVTMDSLFHAVFRAHEHLLIELERTAVVPATGELLKKLQEELKKRGGSLPADIRGDLALYLAVAAALSDGSEPSADVPGAAELVAQARKAEGLSEVELFGRRRVIDFSQFRPRGPHAAHEDLHDHFRAVMWLSRLEFNLVSRSSRSSAPGITPDPSETPREALTAVALADLAASSGATGALGTIERVWGGLAGKREDVSPEALLARWQRAGSPALGSSGAFEALKAAIGQDFQRTARIHYMPQGSAVLPAIATMLGPRITPDTAATRPLVHGEVQGRSELGVADLAFALGHDRATEHLKRDLAAFRDLPAALGKSRDIAQRIEGDDLYTAWLKAIRALSRKPEGATPSFTDTAAFQDLRLNSFAAAYGQLRRNNVLLAGQGYDEGGCEIPDGYVEPAPEVLDQLLAFVTRARGVLGSLDPKIREELKETEKLLERMGRTFAALRTIVRRQLAGEPLHEPERRFLATVAEIIPASSDSPPRYTGWYFQLFPGTASALDSPAFVGDFYTSSNSGQVTYAGATEPTLGLFVVDTGGAPRVMVGPVAQSFELKAPVSRRLTDQEAGKVTGKRAPWQSSYAVDAPKSPRLAVEPTYREGLPEGTLEYRIYHPDGGTPRPGAITVELFTHHRQPCARGSGVIAGKEVKIRLKVMSRGDETCPGSGVRITLNGQIFIQAEAWSMATFGTYEEPHPEMPAGKNSSM